MNKADIKIEHGSIKIWDHYTQRDPRPDEMMGILTTLVIDLYRQVEELKETLKEKEEDDG
jgi:hypothetical protein